MATLNLAARRRQNLDASRRVTFSENTNANNSRLYDYSEDEDEEEQERALSELHGESEEGGGERKRKKEETDNDIAQELEQEVKKAIKKPRPQLLPSHLTSAEGLIRLPVEMKQIKYRPRKGKKRDVAAAAAYSSKLINAYRSFCDDLFPSMAFEDVLLKIEQLGSKKEVKSFVQHMRDDVRNKHLEKLYGREKAEQMLAEVDEHMKQQEEEQVVDEFGELVNAPPPTENREEEDNVAVESSTTRRASYPVSGERTSISNQGPTDISSLVTPTAAPKAPPSGGGLNNDNEEEEHEATFDDDDGLNTPVKMNEKESELEEPVPPEEEKESSPVVQAPLPSRPLPKTRLRIEDSDDEEEATFDDIAAPSNSGRKETCTKEDDEINDSSIGAMEEEVEERKPSDETNKVASRDDAVHKSTDNEHEQVEEQKMEMPHPQAKTSEEELKEAQKADAFDTDQDVSNNGTSTEKNTDVEREKETVEDPTVEVTEGGAESSSTVATAKEGENVAEDASVAAEA